jgi:acyl carrier protein
MFDEVKQLIVGKFTVAPANVTATATIEELGLDSLDVVEFAELATERLGVEISDDEVFELDRLDRIVALLESRRSA